MPQPYKKRIVIRNVNHTAGKLFCQFLYGECFVSFKVNNQNETFEIEVTREVSKEEIKAFVDFWGERFVFFYRDEPVV